VEAGSTAAGSRAVSGAPALGTARRSWGEDLIKVLLVMAALVSVLTTTGIVFSLLGETLAFFGEINFIDYIFGTKWSPLFEPGSFGVIPLITGTFLITGIALLVAVPLGLGSAIYLSEYAQPRTRRAIKPVLELLAGVPTIVFGYFALTFFTPEILRGLFDMDVSIFNALSAGIVMGFMIIPTIASVSDDAMSAVPQSLREGAFGLGAAKLQVALRVVFPAALSGVVAAIVLGTSRAIGETMIVLVAAGQIPNLTADPRSPIETMTTFIGATAKGDLPTGSIEYKTIFAVGTTLFVITLLMNAISIRFVRKYRQVYE
jgi:phosphate transport system permease protein